MVRVCKNDGRITRRITISRDLDSGDWFYVSFHGFGCFVLSGFCNKFGSTLDVNMTGEKPRSLETMYDPSEKTPSVQRHIDR